MNIQKERNYYIDFLKFIFSLIIVSYHSWLFTGVYGTGYFNRGYFAVDFYFIVTGFLFINSIEKLSKKKTKENIGKLDIKFVWSRLKSLLPNIIFITIVGYILVNYRNILDYHLLFSDSTVTESLLLGFIGNGMTINNGIWYISVMLVMFFLLFPLAYKYKKTYNYYIAPLIIILSLGIVEYAGLNIYDPVPRRFIFIDGFYKGLIFMNLGVIAYEICNYMKSKKFSKKERIWITIIETGIYLFLLMNMQHSVAGRYLIAILFLIAVSITFSNVSYTSKVFTSPIFKKLGKFGFILYLTNIPVRTFVATTFNASYYEMLLIYWTLTIILSLVSYVLSEILLPKIIKNKKEEKAI